MLRPRQAERSRASENNVKSLFPMKELPKRSVGLRQDQEGMHGIIKSVPTWWLRLRGDFDD